VRIVWDFGGVLFQWRPPELIKRELPQRATTDEQAAHWVRAIFQGYEGDWGHFDRGTVEVPDLVRRIARRTGLTEAEVQAVVDGAPAARRTRRSAAVRAARRRPPPAPRLR
jgi:putative hydrolase of the HAD superfamily